MSRLSSSSRARCEYFVKLSSPTGRWRNFQSTGTGGRSFLNSMGHKKAVSRFNRWPASAGFELGFGAGFFAAAMPDPPPPRRAFSFAFWRSLRIRRSSYGSQKRGVDGEDATGLGRGEFSMKKVGAHPRPRGGDRGGATPSTPLARGSDRTSHFDAPQSPAASRRKRARDPSRSAPRPPPSFPARTATEVRVGDLSLLIFLASRMV